MRLRDFIEENKDQIDECIKRIYPNVELDYEERLEWIMNDEGLYNWAKSEGCKI